MSKKGLQEEGPGSWSQLWRLYILEIGACLLILLLPIVIVATVYPYAGRPLPQWPLGITLNVILVAYSSFLKVNLTFITASCLGQLGWRWFTHGRPLYDFVRYDRASRGAWDSLRLLWAQRFRQPLTVLAGTILVLSMFIDASLQLLIDQNDCSSRAEGIQATLPRTNMFDDTSNSPTFGDDIVAAVMDGTRDSGNEIDAVCPTGNCTFSNTYGTIGYCSSCQDSSAEISIKIGCRPVQPSNPVVLPSDCPLNSTFVIESNLPPAYYGSDPRHLKQLSVTYNLTRSPWDSEWEFDSEHGLEVSRFDVVYDQSDNLPERIVVRILVGMTSFSNRHLDVTSGNPLEGCQDANSGNSWRCRGYGAATCMIQPCVRIYNASVERGQTTETKIIDTGLMSWAPDPTGGNTGLGMLDTDCLKGDQKEKLTKQGYDLKNGTRWLPYNATTWPDANSPMVDAAMAHELLGQKCLYFIDTGFASSMAPFLLQGQFSGVIKAHGGHNGPNSETDFAIYDFTGNSVLRHIYNSGRVGFDRIESAFSNISDSLTTYIRTHGDVDYSDAATGQAFHYATCLRVNWPWLAFPSALILLTLVLFVMTAYSARAQGVPVWTTFLLPWMVWLSGVPQDQDFQRMEKIAKEIHVTFHTPPNLDINISTSRSE
ncbi:hypothetical protein F4801DRAFT_503529 [Xylaria longipes]|nr:hypothetical protein F4801DRAFT_503529 [Xylaria longipes]